MSFSSFLDKQNGIYAHMRAEAGAVMKSGIRFEKNLFARRGGFVVALKHSPAVADALEALSRQIADIVPSVSYRADEIHTTLGMCGTRTDFLYNPSDADQRTTLDALCDIAERICEDGFREEEVFVEFDGCILTPEVVIAAGTPSPGFVELIEALAREANRRGIEMQSAWGAHVTVARFKGERSGAAVARLARLVGEVPPVGRSVAPRLAVGYSLWGLSPEVPRMEPERIQGQFATYRERTLEGTLA